MSFAPVASPPVADTAALVDAVARDIGGWVVVELGGLVVAHGVGSTPCPPAVATALVHKSARELRAAVRWRRGCGGLWGTVDGAPVTATDLGGGATAWVVASARDADESQLALLAAAVHATPATIDTFVAELLHPRGLRVRRSTAPQAVLVVMRADTPLAALCTQLRRVVAGTDIRVHTEDDAVVAVLPAASNASALVDELRVHVPTVVAGVADVRPHAPDWVAAYRLAAECAAVAKDLGLPLGDPRSSKVAAELLVREARQSITDLVQHLPADPLAPLRAHDARSGTQLFPSLAAWCVASFDVSAAAGVLHVHHNTLRYRLQRSESICSIDLHDPRQRLALQLLLGV